MRAFILGIIIVSFIIAFIVFPHMPDTMASHWNAQGIADGKMSRGWGVFFMPCLMLALALLLLVIPRIDPLQKNVKTFQKEYDRIVAGILLFLLYLYTLTLVWNSGVQFNMMRLLSPAFAALFILIGVMLPKTRRNWFIGIRTPWTLSSDKVWEKTHHQGGLCFIAAGLLALGGVILPSYAIWFILAPPVLAAVYTVVYSYILFRKS